MHAFYIFKIIYLIKKNALPDDNFVRINFLIENRNIVFFSCLRSIAQLVYPPSPTHNVVAVIVILAAIIQIHHLYTTHTLNIRCEHPNWWWNSWISAILNSELWWYYNMVVMTLMTIWLPPFFWYGFSNVTDELVNCDILKQTPKVPAIQDDADGHLIYHTGDILHNRCSW